MNSASPASASRRLALCLLGGGLLATGSLEAPPAAGRLAVGPYPTLEVPVLEVRLANRRLALTGVTASRRHEIAIGKLITGHLTNHEADLRLYPGVLLPAAWEPLSLELLRAVAILDSAHASMRPTGINLRGVTANRDEYARRLASLRAAAPDSIAIDANVTAVDADVRFAELCDSAFRAIGSRTVEFEHASARLRTTAHAVLDRLIEFAWNCRDGDIRITGHTDASGDESLNLALSRQRAAAVAAYLARGGVDRERLYVEGKGSAVPIGSNGTAHGRRLNRRIDFSLTR